MEEASFIGRVKRTCNKSMELKRDEKSCLRFEKGRLTLVISSLSGAMNIPGNGSLNTRCKSL